MRVADLTIPTEQAPLKPRMHAAGPTGFDLQEVLRHSAMPGHCGWKHRAKSRSRSLPHAIYSQDASDNEAVGRSGARGDRALAAASGIVRTGAELIELTARHGRWSPQDFRRCARRRRARFLYCYLASALRTVASTLPRHRAAYAARSGMALPHPRRAFLMCCCDASASNLSANPYLLDARRR